MPRSILDDLPPGAVAALTGAAFDAGAEAKAREVFEALVWWLWFFGDD